MRSHEPRSTSSCAACKLLKRRCSPTCIFAPYFRSDEPKKFAKVHKVFGASNVSKILIEVPEEQREDTVNSLVYEAEARLRDPVYGCIGAIALLQRKMIELQHDLALARARLARYAANYSTGVAGTELDRLTMTGLGMKLRICYNIYIVFGDEGKKVFGGLNKIINL
ncbi:LOB domain-containing protein 21-like isoform X2 [Gossypium arboreum]|uniref:LOB domain-containing protein 21-like isoform X2 n=1 Tax=Gossypium arboreum TaxID=29729 RepID=UPI0022F14AEC|nr:LOB domain-containing protein 21-like isoform X2 [Gossypium arboreum]